jgi:hypothetical protein
MSIIEVKETALKLDKNGENVFDGKIFTVKSGSYRITVVPIYRHRYTSPITFKGKFTVKQIVTSVSWTSSFPLRSNSSSTADAPVGFMNVMSMAGGQELSQPHSTLKGS